MREGVLTHHRGEVRGQLLLGPRQGRDEVDWRLAVEPLRPFLPEGDAKNGLGRLALHASSSCAMRLQGDRGAVPWRHVGRFQLRDFPIKEARCGRFPRSFRTIPRQMRRCFFAMRCWKCPRARGKFGRCGWIASRAC